MDIILMGSGANYSANSEEKWEVTGYVGGYKVLRQKKDSIANNLPTYSKTTDVYFKKDATGDITQMRVYGEKNSRGVREPIMDVDLGYRKGHRQTNNTQTGDGVLHIHDFRKIGEGKFVREKDARPPTQAEVQKYYSLWKLANPNVRIKRRF